MINITYEVGVLGWTSTIVFWPAVVMVIYGIIKALNRDNINKKIIGAIGNTMIAIWFFNKKF